MKALVVILLPVFASSLLPTVHDGYACCDPGQGISAPAPPPPPVPPAPPQRPDLGKWWKNSAVVRDLGLSDGQINQIEQDFLSHRLKLIDLRSALDREEAQLKPLMASHTPDTAKVSVQLDRVLAARDQLERENTMMLLDIRRALSLEQWKKLEALQERRLAPPPAPAAPAAPAPPSPPPPPPPPSPPEGDEVYRVGGPVSAPILEYQPLPQYPQEARDAHIEGVVVIECIVRKNGSVTDAKIVRGLGHGLDEAALNAVTSEWRFKPGTRNNKPVNVRSYIEISYRLK